MAKKEDKHIPEELEDIFRKVEDQVKYLHARWIIYKQLFGTSKERVNLLNESASTFFGIIQNVLLDDIQLTLSKLADPAQTKKGEANLSLEAIYKKIKGQKEGELHSKLKKILSNYRKKCEAFKKHRNKRIAHFDFETIRRKSKSLPGVSRRTIESTLEELRNFMNEINSYYTDSETGYEHSLMLNNGDTLVEVLKRGLRYEELWREGKIDIMDLQKSKYYEV